MEPPQDLIESPPSTGSRLSDRWAVLSRRRRVALIASILALAAATVGAYGVTEVRTSLATRALDEQVVLQAVLGASAWSMAAGGGRVDFFASVLNAGQRPVVVTGVQISAPRLRITSPASAPLPIAPGETALVPLSVLLDCVDPAVQRAAGSTSGLDGTVLATANSGRRRSVATYFGDARLVTDVADTLCGLAPGLHNVELDGPVS